MKSIKKRETFSFGKKGQEGTSTTTIIGWVIGIILLVVVGTIIYKFSQQSSDITKLLPDSFQKAATYCQSSPFSSNNAQYCSDFKEFDLSGGVVKYYACDKILAMLSPPVTPAFDCSSTASDAATAYCARLIAEGKVTKDKKISISDVLDCVDTSTATSPSP